MNIQIDNPLNIPKDLLQQIQEQTPNSPSLSPLIEKITTNPTYAKRFTYNNNILWHENRLCIPENIRKTLLNEAHDSNIGGHADFNKTYNSLAYMYFWPGMTQDIKRYVKHCDSCQRNKPLTQQEKPTPSPHDIPEDRWTDIGMDFIIGLPKTKHGNNAIWTTVDHLSKRSHYIPYQDPINAKEFAILFIREHFRLHGLPNKIISDRDSKFTSKFWKALMKNLKTKLNISTAFHPQTDGQTERFNRTIETTLRQFTNYQQDDWDKLLPIAEFAINNHQHAITKQTPFQLEAAFHPRTPFGKPPTSNNPAANELTAQLYSSLRIAQDAINNAQLRTIDTTIPHDSKLQPGDSVLISTKNYHPPPDKNRPTAKLAPKFMGPFPIIQAKGDSAFLIKLPSDYKMHPVFNKSILRRYHKPTTENPTPVPLPPIQFETGPEYQVEEIIDHKGTKTRRKFLVRWKGYPEYEATWEPQKHVEDTEALEKYLEQHPECELTAGGGEV